MFSTWSRGNFKFSRKKNEVIKIFINKAKIINIDKDVKIAASPHGGRKAKLFFPPPRTSHRKRKAKTENNFSLFTVFTDWSGGQRMKNWNFHTSFLSIQRDEAFMKGHPCWTDVKGAVNVSFFKNLWWRHQ